ncbi:MAG: Endo-1,4-beta-xylanase A precursor [Firmicutes bacterium ADurb.Bin193]|nr:MAG: Endo-1,4-beta-xylanase A precursor [Firmicutes bacterium ADurb.Bin193]
MFKNSKFFVALILIFCLVIPPVQADPDVEQARNATLDFLSQEPAIISFWDACALKGAGIEVDDGVRNIEAIYKKILDEKSLPTDYAGFILGVLALGGDPRRITDEVTGNSVERLAAFQDPDSGGFSELANQHVWAMIALDTVKEPYDVQKAIAFLISLKKPDGGYNDYAETSDPDMTAMALVALSKHKGKSGVNAAIKDAVDFLIGIQCESGGFSSWGAENSNTIATVISGLVAVGENVFSSKWKKNGKTMVDALLTFALEDGSFKFLAEDPEYNLYATVQALIALNDIVNKKSTWSSLEVKTVTSNVRIEGISETILNDSVSVTYVRPKAADAIIEILERENIEYVITDTIFGKYVSSINGEEENTFKDFDGWQFAVNCTPASVGIADYDIEDGDEIVLYYGSFPPKTLFPKYTISPDTLKAKADITFTLTSEYFDWETNKNITVPIEGVNVMVGEKTYVTDSDGKAVIDDIDQSGTYKVSISKEQEGSYPAIVRISEFEINVKKADPPPPEPEDDDKEEDNDDNGGGRRGTYFSIPAISMLSPSPSPTPTPTPTPTPVSEPKAKDLFLDGNEISDWAENSVVKAKQYNIMQGNDNNRFRPRDNITRAEFTAILMRLLKKTESGAEVNFTDVEKDKWYYEYVCAASGAGFITGYDDGTFRPEGTITREEMAVIICRAVSLGESDIDFDDGDQISPWALSSVRKVSANAIITGYEGKFDPKSGVTREMAATVMVRLYERYFSK